MVEYHIYFESNNMIP